MATAKLAGNSSLRSWEFGTAHQTDPALTGPFARQFTFPDRREG